MASNRGMGQTQQQRNSQQVVTGDSFASGGAAVDGGEYEKSKVKNLCRAGGVSMSIPKGEVSEFVQVLTTMDTDVVCESALDLLTSERKEVRAKAWGLIGELMGEPKCEAFLRECYEELEMRCRDEEQVRVKLVAKKVVKAVGGGGGEVVESKERTVSLEDAVAAVERTASEDLLDFGNPPPPAPASNVTSTSSDEGSYVKVASPPKKKPSLPPPPPPTNGGDMFGGMNVKPSSTTTSTTTTFDDPNTPLQTETLTQTNGLGDMFGGMDINTVTDTGTNEGNVNVAGQQTQPTSSFGFLSSPPPETSQGNATVEPISTQTSATVDPFAQAGLEVGMDKEVKPIEADVISPTKTSKGGGNDGGVNTFDPLLSGHSPTPHPQMIGGGLGGMHGGGMVGGGMGMGGGMMMNPAMMQMMQMQMMSMTPQQQQVIMMQQQRIMQQQMAMMQQQQGGGGPSGGERGRTGSGGLMTQKGPSIPGGGEGGGMRKGGDDTFDFVKDAMKKST